MINSLRRLAPLLTIGLALALAACGSTASPDAGAADVPATKVVTDGKGNQVTVPTRPERALGFYTTDVDILVTLGIPLAPLQPIRTEGYTAFPDFFPTDKLAGISTFANYPEYNYEKVLEAEPDLILNGLGYDADVVKRLPDIAPTYSVDAFDGQDWRIHFAKTAADLGRTEQHDAWLATYAQQVATAKADIAAAGAEDLTVAGFSYWDGKAQVACYGVPCLAFDDLGLPQTPLQDVKDLSLSAEQLGQLKDVDVVFVGKGPGAAGQAEFDETMKQLNRIPTWRALPFVQNKMIFTFDMEMNYGSPSGQSAFLEVVRAALTTAP